MSVIKFPGSVKNFSFHLGPNVFYNVTTFVYSKLAVKTISFPHLGSRLPTFTTESVAAERYRANNSLASLKIKTNFLDISLRTAQLVTLEKKKKKKRKKRNGRCQPFRIWIRPKLTVLQMGLSEGKITYPEEKKKSLASVNCCRQRHARSAYKLYQRYLRPDGCGLFTDPRCNSGRVFNQLLFLQYASAPLIYK